MKLHFRFSFPSIEEEQVFSFEHEIGFVLPKDYKIFLFKNNGGRPKEDVVFNIPGLDEIGCLCDLYGFGEKTKETVEDIRRVYKILEDRIPFGFVSIGEDGSGDEILLASEASNAAGVFFFDAENSSDENYGRSWDQYGNIYKISESFSSFMEQLHSLEEKNE
jgi:hypothetical protein